jgi:pyruvate,water dikinase
MGMEILWLGDSACHDRLLVGGKVANLSRLAADHRVPPGFCLTAGAFGHASVDGSPLQSELYDKVALAYQRLAEQCGVHTPSVAVRSSAVDEDGAEASFAGQHETYLNVVGVEAVVAAIVRCWASLRSERALEYRRQRRLSVEGARLAVLVQQLVPADVSAVLFSANPVTARRDQIVINANWGLGESIVGGTVTPDTYVVNKAGLGVVSRLVGEKRRMTVAVAGGTREVEVPRLLRGQPTLTDDEAMEMANLALALEQTMGWPVDVECAISAGRLYLLQCRPVTTLADSVAVRGSIVIAAD